MWRPGASSRAAKPLRIAMARLNATSCTAIITLLRVWIRSRRMRKRSEEHTSELQSRSDLVCRLLLEKKKHIQHHLVTHRSGDCEVFLRRASHSDFLVEAQSGGARTRYDWLEARMPNLTLCDILLCCA